MQEKNPFFSFFSKKFAYFMFYLYLCIVILKKLRSAKRGIYHDRRVYQLFLSPVHPKKRRWIMGTSEQCIPISPLVTQYLLAA